MINIMLKNVDLNDKWWIELIKTISYFRNRFSMTNKSIISYEIDTKKKSFLAHLRRIETTSYAMKRKSVTKCKKLVLKSFFAVLVEYEENHIYRMLRFNEIIYRVSFIIWIKKKREESFLVEISDKASAKRSVFESIESSTKRQVIESNSIIILMSSSQLNQSTVIASLISTLFTAEFNTSSTESISSISILSALKRHFELRYRLDFFDSLNLLIMRCMKNVIDSQQILKSRSYKKTINDSSRDEWLKIMKNENKSFLINEIWTLINLSKNRRVLRDKWIYKIKRNEHDEILRYKTRWVIRDFEQIERLNYTKTFVSMIKSMNYKTMYVIIVVNDWKIEQMNVKIAFLYDKIHENVFVVQLTKFEQRINQICKLNKALYELKQSSRVWFETLIKFFFSRLRFFKRRIQRVHEERHHDRHLCERSDFYRTQSRDYFLIKKRFKRSIWDERFRLVHVLFRHDDLSKSTSQIVNSESKFLCRTDATRSWNVRLQITDHLYERLVSSD
jgi:hypothetical protein